VIYTAPYVMFLIRADPLQGQVGGGWALEIDTFLGPVKWHRAVRQVPYVVMSTIPKRKYKRSDIEANCRNETKTF
jgi:hypothetical protein